MKYLLEYYDKELESTVQLKFEAETDMKARKMCEKILAGKKYSKPALYDDEEES